MEWTQNTPTREGLYWFWGSYSRYNIIPVEITLCDNGCDLQFRIMGASFAWMNWEFGKSPRITGWWMRMEMPEEPETGE